MTSGNAFLLKTTFFPSPDLKIHLIKITQKLGAIPSFSRVCLTNQFLQPKCLCMSNICHQRILIFILSVRLFVFASFAPQSENLTYISSLQLRALLNSSFILILPAKHTFSTYRLSEVSPSNKLSSP